MTHASRPRVPGAPAGSPRRATGDRHHRPAARLACALCLASAAASAWSQEGPPAAAPDPAASQAANPPPRLSVELREAATDNAGLDDRGRRQADFITSFRPALEATHKGAGFNADLVASALLMDYARGSQPDGLLPDVHGSLDATLVPRWLKVDIAGYLRAAEADPFGARTDDVTGVNRRNQWGVLFGPTLQRALSPDTSVVVRHQFGVARGAGTASAPADDRMRLDTNSTLVRIERKPTPLGLSVELTRLDNHASSDQGDSRYTVTTGRLRGALVVDTDLTLSLLAGQDRSDFLLSSHVDPLYGAALDWTPGSRTHFALEIEHRYFGESGRLHLDHRTPFLSLAVDLQRQPVDATSSFGSLAQGVDVRSALNAILTTRYPDPATRAGVVDGVVSSRGLDTRTAGAIDLLGDYPQLQTSAQASLVLLGVRDVLTLSGYAQTMRVLARDGDPLAGLSVTTADNRQRGASVLLEHRLTAQLSSAVLGNWSRIAALSGTRERSAEQTWRVSLLDHVSPRSDLTVALQWYRFDTAAAGQRSFDATLGLVGLSHRF